MSDAMEESLTDVGPELASEGANGEVVHWMDKPPLRLGPAGISMAAVGGFALGVAATLAVLAFSDLVDPLVEIRRRRSLPDG